MKKVAIIVLNYKNWQETIECLHSLSKISYDNIDIIVVDNASNNDSLDKIRSYLIKQNIISQTLTDDFIKYSTNINCNTILIQSKINNGYAAGNNLGIKVALKRNAEYILILNNDTIVSKNFLEPLVSYLELNTKIGAVGPKIYNSNGGIDLNCARRRITPLEYFFRLGIGSVIFPNNRWCRRHYYKGEYLYDHPKEVDILAGSCILLKKSVIEKIGLLDEKTFLYYEELILHEKLRSKGFLSAIIPESSIIHKHGASTSCVNSKELKDAHTSSAIYYLSNYRGYSKLTIKLLLLLRLHPNYFYPSFSFYFRKFTK